AETAKPIHVGNNVWFGGGVKVLPGVTIGDNCVISAGTIITKDGPAGHLASGNPAVYTPLAPHNGGPKDIQSN
ncbi:MAG: hypothetical protein IKL98_10245, partial [Akkermansia sp.]|nr:hypothetical protein [Akkermansia sp.]